MPTISKWITRASAIGRSPAAGPRSWSPRSPLRTNDERDPTNRQARAANRGCSVRDRGDTRRGAPRTMRANRDRDGPRPPVCFAVGRLAVGTVERHDLGVDVYEGGDTAGFDGISNLVDAGLPLIHGPPQVERARLRKDPARSSAPAPSLRACAGPTAADRRARSLDVHRHGAADRARDVDCHRATNHVAIILSRAGSRRPIRGSDGRWQTTVGRSVFDHEGDHHVDLVLGDGAVMPRTAAP